MSFTRPSWTLASRVIAVLCAGVVLGASGCARALSRSDGAGSAGTVTIAVYPWIGYEANAAVVSTILKTRLNYKVNLRRMTATESWIAMNANEIDVILENWSHLAEKKRYIEEEGIAVSAGPTGNKGVVGWYTPIWMVQEYPGILDWRNLNRYASVFAKDGSGGRGVLLESEESYITYDSTLVANLKLNYNLDYSGSEWATIQAAQDATSNRKPLLFYFWEPHFLFDQSRYARVNLPEYVPGCDAIMDRIACDYPVEDLDKIVSRKFADSGGKAFEFIKKFSWTNADQNEVARYIGLEKMSYREAASSWMYAHPDAWRPWLRP
jgi:glycine betaine/proline transport system substrate-binding protein